MSRPPRALSGGGSAGQNVRKNACCGERYTAKKAPSGVEHDTEKSLVAEPRVVARSTVPAHTILVQERWHASLYEYPASCFAQEIESTDADRKNDRRCCGMPLLFARCPAPTSSCCDPRVLSPACILHEVVLYIVRATEVQQYPPVSQAACKDRQIYRYGSLSISPARSNFLQKTKIQQYTKKTQKFQKTKYKYWNNTSNFSLIVRKS